MSRPRSITIKEVAAHADVSVATVSRVMQFPDLVTQETTEKVKASMAALGYKPNIQARNFRTNRSGVIVALVPNMANPFFTEVLRGIEEGAVDRGYWVLVGESRMDAAREQAYVDLVSGGQADGLITFTGRVAWPRGEGAIPVVNATAHFDDPDVTSVDVDGVAASRTATEYLIALGHRQIAFISGPKNSPNSKDRLQGYKAALTSAKLKFEDALVAGGAFTIESGVRAAEQLLDRNLDITAIFCANDEMALGAMNVVRARGLRVPEDVSVIGFDDISFAKHFTPPLTTVSQPMLELGREAVGLLLEILANRKTPPRKRVLPASLVVRGSTGPVRKPR